MDQSKERLRVDGLAYWIVRPGSRNCEAENQFRRLILGYFRSANLFLGCIGHGMHRDSAFRIGDGKNRFIFESTPAVSPTSELKRKPCKKNCGTISCPEQLACLVFRLHCWEWTERAYFSDVWCGPRSRHRKTHKLFSEVSKSKQRPSLFVAGLSAVEFGFAASAAIW